jgi:hypothetical protein
MDDKQRATLIMLCTDMAVSAGELFGALLAVRVPDHAERGTTNFTQAQAFELTKILLAHAVEETG